MGAINYSTSDYITLGIKPHSVYDLENDADFMATAQKSVSEYGGTVDDCVNDMIQSYYEDDENNVSIIMESYDFYYFHIAIKPGYYEGFTLDVESNFPVDFDCWQDKRDAQKELTQLKKCLLECAGVGMVQCSPGWCTSYNDYNGTCKAIKTAIKKMREEVRSTPTWLQYNREA